ncbi:ribosomal protein S5 domain 2-like protein [Ramaria rubella]|nr:ribosomal protein S5 domain 2-like protein [Ramaria rubella]
MTSKSEKSYIQTSLLSDPPFRADGRSLVDYRAIQLAIGVAASANGSARVSVGGTEILAACKLEVEDVATQSYVDEGRISCAVSCSPSAYPHHSPASIDDLQSDLSQFLNSTLSHPSLRPSNLTILPRKKSWVLNLDCIILSDAGNIYDALFMAARAALWDTRVPITRPIEYKAPRGATVGESALDTRRFYQAADFELRDYWSEGEILDGKDRWPVCITLYLISSRHFLDATTQEDAAVPVRLLLVFSCESSGPPTLQGTRMIGSGEMGFSQLKTLVTASQKYAKELVAALNAKLQSELLRRSSK